MMLPPSPPAILSVAPRAAVVASARMVVNLGGVRPTVTIRKVVRGNEPAPGSGYSMRMECWSPADAYLSTSGQVVSFGGQTFQATPPDGIGTGIRLVIPGASYVIAGLVNNADVSSYTFEQARDLLEAIRAFNASAVNVRNLPPSSLLPQGRFALANGGVRTFGPAEFPGLGLRTFCDVTELDTQGSVVSYASTNRLDPVRPGVQVNDVFKSAPTAAGVTESITVTNSFVGELIVSKAVTGDPMTNIAIYEVAVDCGPNRPMERFVLRDRQSRVITDIPAGTNCFVTELKSDGAQVTFTDNSGDHPNDGRVVILRNTPTCGRGVVGEENSCVASVIITNAYGPVASLLAARTTPTTLAPTTSTSRASSTTSTTSTTTIPGGSTTTSTVLIVFGVTTTTLRNVDRLFSGPLPPVDEAPAHAIDAEPTFTG